MLKFFEVTMEAKDVEDAIEATTFALEVLKDPWGAYLASDAEKRRNQATLETMQLAYMLIRRNKLSQ